jgi:Tfp pilus assembly PilM family ATPase
MSLFGGGLIGVDVEGRFIKAAQLRGPARHPRLVSAIVLPKTDPNIPVGRADVEHLSGALSRQGFEGRRLVLAVPEEKIVAGMLELPPRSSGAPLDAIACGELATMHNYDPNEAEAVTWDLPASCRVKDATQAMAVACRHTDAEALLALFEESGLEVAALESRLHGAVRGCRGLLHGAGITAVLDLEWNGAILVLWHQDAVIYKWTMAQAGLRHLAKAIGDGLGLDPAEADCLLADVGLAAPAGEDPMAYEAGAAVLRKHFDAAAGGMESPLAYAIQQYPEAVVETLLVTGPGAAIPGLDAFLKNRLSVPKVQRVAPADVVACPDPLGGKAQDPSLVVAVGLAQFAE